MIKEYEQEMTDLATEQVLEIHLFLKEITKKFGLDESKKAFVCLYTMHMAYMCGEDINKIQNLNLEIQRIIKQRKGEQK